MKSIRPLNGKKTLNVTPENSTGSFFISHLEKRSGVQTTTAECCCVGNVTIYEKIMSHLSPIFNTWKYMIVSFLRGASLYIGFKIGLWKVTLRNLKEFHKNFHFGRIKIWATLTWTSEPLTGNWVLKMRVHYEITIVLLLTYLWRATLDTLQRPLQNILHSFLM